MKNFLFVYMLFIFASTSSAEEQILFKNSNLESGGFGGPITKITELNGEGAVLFGGQGGWIINHTFFLGGGGYGLVTEHDAPDKVIALTGNNALNMDFGYGGLLLGFIGDSDNLSHYTVSTLIGGGNVDYMGNTFYLKDFSKNDSFFVIEPELNAELNLTKWFRMTFGVSYRYVTDIDITGLNNSDISGLTGTIGFKYGTF